MARIDFGSKPLITPMPVLIIGTYDEDGNPNVMNAAWGMISDYKEISISLSKHKTTENFAKTGAFTVSIGTEDTVTECDFVGVVSANDDPQKFAKTNWHASKSTKVNAPLIDELKMALECKVKSFNDGILIGEIINVTADESVLDSEGNIDIKKLKPIAYNPCDNTYVSMGSVVGAAFADGLKLK